MNTRVVIIVALFAAALGAIAGLLVSGPGPLWRSALGQKLLQGAIEANAPPPPAGVPVAREGDLLPPLRLRHLDGRATEVPGAWQEQPLLINVWASWCGPCRQEMGSLDRLARRFGPQQLAVIGISTDDYPDNARAFLRVAGTSFSHFIDHDLILENMLGANRLPLTVLVDAKGRVLDKIYGATVWDSPEMIEAIRQIFHLRASH